jgi:hypothetical protein
VLHRTDGTRLVLFESEFHLRRSETDHPGVLLETLLDG